MNIFVLGHPGAGKGFFAKTLASKLGYEFIDADLGLEAKVGAPLENILGKEGIRGYASIQDEILQALDVKEKTVVATDGPIALSKKAAELLQDALIVFLKTSTQIQMRRSLRNQKPLLNHVSYEQLLNTLHEQRDEIYERLSDVIIDGDEGDIDEHVSKVCQQLDIASDESMESTLHENELVFFKYNTDTPVTLTQQQALTLKYLADGLSSKEIARHMNISHRTVEGYIAQLKEKLSCNSSKDLISLYHANP
jgi:shikimate kinase